MSPILYCFAARAHPCIYFLLLPATGIPLFFFLDAYGGEGITRHFDPSSKVEQPRSIALRRGGHLRQAPQHRGRHVQSGGNPSATDPGGAERTARAVATNPCGSNTSNHMRRSSPDDSHPSRRPSLDRPCVPISGATGRGIPCRKLPRQVWRSAGRSSRAALPSNSAAHVWVHRFADVAAAEQGRASFKESRSKQCCLGVASTPPQGQRRVRRARFPRGRARDYSCSGSVTGRSNRDKAPRGDSFRDGLDASTGHLPFRPCSR